MFKKIVLILCLVAVVGTTFAHILDKDYEPLSFSQVLKIVSDSGISYESSLKIVDDLAEYANRADTFVAFDKFTVYEEGDEVGFLMRIYNIMVNFFNNVLDYYVMCYYVIKLVIMFVLDTLVTVIKILGILTQLVGLTA